MKAFCFDIFNNVKEERVWISTLPPYIMRILRSDHPFAFSEESYKFSYAEGAKRERACIERILPNHLINWAKQEIKTSLSKQIGEEKAISIKDRFYKALEAFHRIDNRITEAKVLEYLDKRSFKELTSESIVSLLGIYNSLKDRISRPEEYFNLAEKEVKKEETKPVESKEKF